MRRGQRPQMRPGRASRMHAASLEQRADLAQRRLVLGVRSTVDGMILVADEYDLRRTACPVATARRS